MSNDGGQWVSSFLLGALFVWMYCSARFVGPFADRSCTTFYRYSIALCYYAIVYLGLYCMILAASLWAIGSLLPDYTGALGSGIGPASVALLVVALSRLPGLSTLDHMFRRHARYIGGIPMEVRRLRDAIRAAKREIGEESSNEIHHSVLRRGLDLGNMRSVPDHTLHSLFLHAAQLKYFLAKCQQEPRFSSFFEDNARQLHDLSRRFDHLMFKSSRGVDAIGGLNELINRTSGKSDNWDILGSLVENEVYAARPNVLDPAMSTSRLLLGSLRDDMRFFIDDAAMILARLTMYYRWTERGRVELLKQIGVPVPLVPQPRFGYLFVVFAVVFVAMFVSITVFGDSGTRTVRQLVGLLIMVPSFFVAGLFSAIYPKQYFAFANRSVFGRPPYPFFIVAGVVAAVLAFVIGMVIRTLIYQSGEQAFQAAIDKSPWLLLTVTLAVTVAVLVQDARTFESEAQLRRRRWMDTLILVCALSAAGAVVQLLLPYTDAGHQPRLGTVAILVVLGGFIGYFVPSRFRTPCKKDGRAVPAVRSGERSSALTYSNAS